MKFTLVAALLAFVAVGSANCISALRFRRQIFGDVDPAKVPSMLNNPAFVEAQHRCIMATDTDATKLCDRIGKKLRENLGKAIQKADCPSACTQTERETIVEVISTIQTKYPKIWQEVMEKYAITPEQLKNVDKWIQTVRGAKA